MIFKKILLITSIILLIQCSSSTNSIDAEFNFGIYLLTDSKLTTSDVKKKDIDSLELKNKPILNLDDIITYDWSNHKLDIQSESFERFKILDTMNVSTYGLPFIVIANGERIYLGTIYPLYSSLFHEDLPSINIAPFLELRINRAIEEYADKRTDQRIYKILLNSKKLKH